MGALLKSESRQVPMSVPQVPFNLSFSPSILLHGFLAKPSTSSNHSRDHSGNTGLWSYLEVHFVCTPPVHTSHERFFV